MSDEKENVAMRSDAGDASNASNDVGVLDPSLCGGTAASKGSLQDNFKKFMTQKKKERQLLKLARNGEFNGTCRTEVAKDMLRAKFIDAAKKYLGVPYAERFKDADAPVAPLYLDCCGLVRQAVQDLQEDFGFVIGRWNQAYQMDTLPIVLKEEDLKPGDLIFYEGLYNSKRSKPQKHNNVHVEIFLGGETGEATIGSRYHRGVVSIFPSYKFKSTTWDLVQYHFRSLDTWLNGECRSHCPEHPWHSDLLGLAAAAGKRSIFHESDDESAGGGDIDEHDEDDDVGGGGNDDAADEALAAETEAAVVAPASATPPEVEAADVAVAPAAADEPRDEAVDARAPAHSASPARAGAGAGAARPARRHTQQGAAAGSAAPAHVDDCVSPSAVKTQRSQSADRLRADDKVDDAAASRGDVGGVAISGQRIPNSPSKGLNGVPAGKRGGAARAGIAAAAAAAAGGDSKRGLSISTDTGIASKAKTSGKEKDGGVPPLTYYVGKGNGWRLVKDALDKRCWQQLPFEYSFSSRFGLKWVERRSQIDYRSHTPGQLVNHIPNNDCITTKAALLATLREKYCRVPAASTTRLPTPWLPETYQLDSPADIAAACEVEAKALAAKVAAAAAAAEGDSAAAVPTWGCMWIYKPSCNNRGRGIRVVRGKEALDLVCYGKNTGDPETSVPPSSGILQRYIEDPLLAGAESFKFDVRCYLLVSRNDPTYLAYYHPGYCRLSLKKYSVTDDTLDDPTVHLTNASVQKKDPLYEANKEQQIQTIAEVADKIEQNGQPASAAFLRGEMDEHIKQCMVDVLKAALPKLNRKKGYFDLFGFDFMVTTANKLQLLEVNTNPALSLDNAVLANLLPGVVDGTIELVLRAQGPPGGLPAPADGDAGPGPDVRAPPGSFQLIYDEEAGYEYASPKRIADQERKAAAKAAAAASVSTVAPP